MRVFISWSGNISKEIGEAIKDWLPAVLQNVKPYFTPSDIEKGSRWNADISKELEQSKLGIFIYTKENLDSQWMLFEAGAVSKTLDNSKVCPILFGIDNSDFKGPLTQFQTSQFNKNDFKKLVNSINNSLTENKLDNKVLDEVFEMWWPKLDSKIGKILENKKIENVSIRDDRELLEEILALSRVTVKRTTLYNSSEKSRFRDNTFERLVSEFVFGTESIFDFDWNHTKSCLEDDNMKYFISPEGTFLNPNITDEGNNWGNRPAFLKAYRRLKSYMDENNMGKTNFLFDFDDDVKY